MITQLLEAIADVKMWHISDKHIVILAPMATLETLIREELTNGKDCPEACLSQPVYTHQAESRFNGLVVIEDPSLTQVVVRSLVSGHRAVVQQ